MSYRAIHTLAILIAIAVFFFFPELPRNDASYRIRAGFLAYLTALALLAVIWRIHYRVAASPSVLVEAAGKGDVARVKRTLDSGVDVNARSEEVTALIVAAYRGHRHIVKLLLERGADASIKNPLGYTALEIARKHKRFSVVDLLEAPGPSDAAAPMLTFQQPEPVDESSGATEALLDPALKLEPTEKLFFQKSSVLKERKEGRVFRTITSQRIVEHRRTEQGDHWRQDVLGRIRAIHIPRNKSEDADLGHIYVVGESAIHTFRNGVSDEALCRAIDAIAERSGVAVKRLAAKPAGFDFRRALITFVVSLALLSGLSLLLDKAAAYLRVFDDSIFAGLIVVSLAVAFGASWGMAESLEQVYPGYNRDLKRTASFSDSLKRK